MNTMKALVCREFGPPQDVVALQDVAPAPGPAWTKC